MICFNIYTFISTLIRAFFFHGVSTGSYYFEAQFCYRISLLKGSILERLYKEWPCYITEHIYCAAFIEILNFVV